MGHLPMETCFLPSSSIQLPATAEHGGFIFYLHD